MEIEKHILKKKIARERKREKTETVIERDRERKRERCSCMTAFFISIFRVTDR